MTKKIISRQELRKPMIEAMTEISSIVKRTLGPGGNIILLSRLGQSLDGSPLGPKITKDGVSVAEECADPDPIKDVVMQAIKSICRKTNTNVGDGTTTAIVLGEAILKETIKVLDDNPSLNPQLVKESIEEAMTEVVKKLRNMSIQVDDMTMVEEVATISANGDRYIGKVIGDAFRHVGAEGVVTVDEGSGTEVTLELVDGYQFNKGAEARNAFFNNKEGTQFEAEDCYVLIYDGKIQSHTDIFPAIKLLYENRPNADKSNQLPPFIVIANEFSMEVLQWLLIQKGEAGWKCCPVTGPHMTHVRTGFYDDIAAYTGGTRLGNGSRNLGASEFDDLGKVKRVVISKYKTTLYEGLGLEEDILAKVDQLKALKLQAESPYDAQILNDRIAAVTNGIAKIGVGGVTEMEIKEKYDRIEDALNAARAAIQEGVVPGGGTALLRISNKLDADKSVGHAILKKALETPFLQIMDNIGLSDEAKAEAYFNVCSSSKKVYDARNKQIKNARKSGIIDPVKVTRTALENAISIATLLSTSGGAIIYVKD
jgi:chaperonin GroEL